MLFFNSVVRTICCVISIVFLCACTFHGVENNEALPNQNSQLQLDLPSGFENLPVDRAALLNAKKHTVAYGPYLRALAIVYDNFAKYDSVEELSGYVVTVSEDDQHIIVDLVTPYTRPVLGDGRGRYLIDKTTFAIVSAEFQK